jgi:acetyl esterase/lipase
MVAQVNSPAANILEVANDPRLSKEVKAFLKFLNSGGVALEKLSPIEVTTVQYNGMIHDFGLLNGLAEVPAVRSLLSKQPLN